MILNERDARHEHILQVARQMMTAARTAPKGKFELKVNRSVPFSEERLFMCFDELGLEHELYFKRVNEVSGGQRQRIMLAVAALLNKPLIVILNFHR